MLKWSDMPRPIVCLAPMDGITDSAYRRVVRELAPDVILFSEFTSADGYLRSEKVRRRLEFRPEEHPYFVQLFGSNPDSFAEVARALEQQGVAGIDINMGCPAKKIVASQHGSGLMNDVNLACRIVERVANSGRLEVSVKTRLGWRDSGNLIPFARTLESAGASLITIHGRTYAQAFGGSADWEPIYRLKAELSVPVLGNGDVQHHDDGLALMGPLDGFMIGRAAIGNPWALLSGGIRRQPTLEQKVAMVRRHFQYSRESKSARLALIEFRKHLSGYLRGFPNARGVRREMMQIDDERAFLALLDTLAAREPPLAQAS